MLVHVALGILLIVSLLLSLLLLGQLQRLESLIQTLTAVQLDLDPKDVDRDNRRTKRK